MSKKVFFTLLLILSITFSFTYVFANDSLKGVADGVKNVVGGAENTVENAARGISNTSKNVTRDMQNAGNSMTNNISNTMDDTQNNPSDNDQNSTMMRTDNNDDGRYSATRTAGDAPTLMGMTSTGWTWLILGIVALAIIGLVWYYSMQLTGNNYHDGHDE